MSAILRSVGSHLKSKNSILIHKVEMQQARINSTASVGVFVGLMDYAELTILLWIAKVVWTNSGAGILS